MAIETMAPQQIPTHEQALSQTTIEQTRVHELNAFRRLGGFINKYIFKDDRRIGEAPYIEPTEAELYEYFDAEPGQTLFANRLIAFFNQQRETWPLFKENHERMLKSKRKAGLMLGDAHINVVYQAGRRRNNANHIADAAKRKVCFLGSTGKPEFAKQRSMKFLGKTWILANPFPIIEKCHFTIPIDHTPQLFSKVSEAAFSFAENVKDGWIVFYNGARMGASAPDHSHFQAGQYELPIEADVKEAWDKRHENPDSVKEVVLHDDVDSFIPTQLGRSVIVISGSNKNSVKQALELAINKLPKAENTDEPDINIIITCKRATKKTDTFTAYLFPRTNYRASNFSGDPDTLDENLYAFGVASIEAGGDLVSTLEKDFDKLVEKDEITGKDTIRKLVKHNKAQDEFGNIRPDVSPADVIKAVYKDTFLPIEDTLQCYTLAA